MAVPTPHCAGVGNPQGEKTLSGTRSEGRFAESHFVFAHPKFFACLQVEGAGWDIKTGKNRGGDKQDSRN